MATEKKVSAIKKPPQTLIRYQNLSVTQAKDILAEAKLS